MTVFSYLTAFSGIVHINKNIDKRKQEEEVLQRRTHDLGERVKELTGLYSISKILDHQDISLEDDLELIAEILPPAWHYPEITCARITFDGREFTTENFKETIWRQASEIIVYGEQVGVVEVYYLEEKPELDEGPFLKEERNLINDITVRLGETIERKQAEEALQQRTHDLGERVKELTGLYSISRIFDRQDISLEEGLELIAKVLPPAWHYPEITCARITFDGREFTTENFKETIWRQASEIIVYGEQVGVVEVYYLEEKPELDEGPFLKEERNLIDDIAARLAETIERKQAEEALQQRTHDLGERVKELTALYSISKVLGRHDISLEEDLELIAEVLPPAWHYPEITCARITFDGREFTTENFKETSWRQASDLIVHGKQVGMVEVFYLEEKPELDEGPFLKEERNLIDDIAARLAETIERKQMENETKQLREELTHAERINTVGEMTAALAYELKQYLLTISNYAYSSVNKLHSGKNEPDAYLADMEMISKQAGRARDLLTHVQNFVHRKKPRKDTLDVNQLVREIIDLILTEANSCQVTIILNLDDNLLSTKGDPIQLQQVILNLARNGIEAMQKTDLSSRQLTIATAEHEDSMVAVTISDLGPGVSAKDEDKLFAHFFTTKAYGLGLGLSICRTIIEAHGGKIGFVPDIKMGTVVRFTLPISDESSQTTHQQ